MGREFLLLRVLPSQLNIFSSRFLFSRPFNVSSGEYMITDPHAYTLSVRCGVVNTPEGGVGIVYPARAGGRCHGLFVAPRLTPLCGVITLQNFNNTSLYITVSYQYTRHDGVAPGFVAQTIIKTNPGVMQFGGEKSSRGSPANIHRECCIGHHARYNEYTCSPPVQDVLLRSFPTGESSPEIAERTSVPFLYVSLKPDGLSFPPGVQYASPAREVKNLTVLSWVHDAEYPTASKSRLPESGRELTNLFSVTRPAGECIPRECDGNILRLAACLRVGSRSGNGYRPWKWHSGITKQ